MTVMTQKAVTYSRNSSAKQKSITDQRADNRRAVASAGWDLVAELDDPSSASRYATKVRKNWEQLLELLPEVDVVVLWEPSRGDRTLASWAGFLDACREHRVLIHAVSHQTTYDPGNPRQYRMLAEDGVDSAYESDKTSQRVRRGQASAAIAGRPHGSPTYGYVRRYDPVTRVFQEQGEEPVQAAVVRDIFSAIAGGETLTSVCRRLTLTGVPTPQGAARWLPSTVHFMLSNASYRGVRVYQGEEYPAVWPALVDDLVWHNAQKAIGLSAAERKTRKASAPGAVKYLLSGSAKVMKAPCGSPFVGAGDKAGRLANYSCVLDSCSSAPMRECDEFVTRLIVARLSRKDVRKAWVVDDKAARAAAGELARLTAELEEARASFAAPGGISSAAMAAKEAAMAPAIADAERRAQPRGVSLAILKLLDAARMGDEHVRPAWDRLALTAKREVVTLVFDSLVLGKTTQRITRWTNDADRLVITSNRIEPVFWNSTNEAASSAA